MISHFTSAVFLASLVYVSIAQAQIRAVKDIPASLAVEAVSAAVADCSAKGHNESGTVVDRVGQIKAIQCAGNAGPHSVDTSRRKAYIALTIKSPTTRLMEFHRIILQLPILYLERISLPWVADYQLKWKVTLLVP